MNKHSFPIILLLVLLFTSCVNRIDIPEEEEAKFYINLEMLKGDSQITAEFTTTNNLNGTNPIFRPSSAIINIREQGVDDAITFEFDEDLGLYVSIGDVSDFLKYGQTYNMDAKIDDSEIERVVSSTKVPFMNHIEAVELMDEEIVTDEKTENQYWQGTVGLTFSEAINIDERFGHLHLTSKKTFRDEVNGGFVYSTEGEAEYFELIDVNDGRSSVTDIAHRDGFLVELDELENNYVELILRSPFAIEASNQVTDFIDFTLLSVSKDHHDYHKSLHNIQQTQSSIFVEEALYNSNIENGFGLFSSCVDVTATLNLR